MPPEADTTEGGKTEEVVAPVEDYGDPMFPPEEADDSRAAGTEGEPKAAEEGVRAAEAGAEKTTTATEAEPGTEAGAEEVVIPDDFRAEDYLLGAFDGKMPSQEELAASHKRLQDRVGSKGREDQAIHMRLDQLESLMREGLPEGAGRQKGPVTIEQIEEDAEALTKQQLGERPDDMEDPEAVRKWDRRLQLNAQDVRDEQRQSLDSARRTAAQTVNNFLDNRFNDDARRGAFISEFDTICAQSGIGLEQLSPALLDLCTRGWGANEAISNAFTAGMNHVLDPTGQARRAGTSLVLKPGGSAGPAEAGGDTWEKLSADADAGKVSSEQYGARLNRLKKAGLVP